MKATLFAAVGLAGAIAGCTSPSPEVPPTPSVSIQYPGTSWRVTAVQPVGSSDSTPVPGELGVNAKFLPGGKLLLDDSVNALSGTYRPDARGFVTSSFGSTLVGLADPTDDRRRIVEAVGSIAGLHPEPPWADQTSVRVEPLGPDRIALITPEYRLTLLKTGA